MYNATAPLDCYDLEKRILGRNGTVSSMVYAVRAGPSNTLLL